MGASSCAQDDGLQPRHRVRQLSIAEGRCRGYKSRSIAEPKEWPQCASNVLGSTCAKYIRTLFLQRDKRARMRKGRVSIVLLSSYMGESE